MNLRSCKLAVRLYKLNKAKILVVRWSKGLKKNLSRKALLQG